jgi:hypothetical protein
MKILHRTLPLLAAAATLCAASIPASAQSAPPAAPTAAANPADVASLDAIIAALYASISGPKGAPRDFDRLRSLFAPNARFIVTGRGADNKARLLNWSMDEYIRAAGPGLEANGFFEREIGRTREDFGHVTHIMSAYDSRNTLADPTPFQRGVNSIQLFNAGDRWYIVTVMWDSERPDNPIPARYLSPPAR